MTSMAPPHAVSASLEPPTALHGGDCSQAQCEQTYWLPHVCPAIQEIGTPKTFASGETIFWEDDHANFYFLIESGVARGCRILPDGRRQICRFIFPGDLIAHSQTERYPYTAEAITPVSAIAVPRTPLQQKTESKACLRKILTQSVLAELRESQDQILVLGRMTAVERVSHFFYLLAERTGTDPSQPIIIPMNRTDIADYLGLTLETVSRVIQPSKARREDSASERQPHCGALSRFARL